MRYRALANTGMSVSAVALSLDDSRTRTRASDWTRVIYDALEIGINAFEVTGRDPAIADGVAEALDAIDRRLVFVSWRFGVAPSRTGGVVRDFSAAALKGAISAVLARTGLRYLDAGLLDDPKMSELPAAGLEAMKDARASGQIRLLGVAGEDDAIDAYITTGVFDIISTRFSLLSGWKERLRLKAALERDMVVMGYGFQPDTLGGGEAEQPAKTGLWGKPRVNKTTGGYAFLDETPSWTREDLCLAYALTEPSMASVLISSDRVDRLEALAAVPDRDLPSGAGAQIEMARFAYTPAAKARKA